MSNHRGRYAPTQPPQYPGSTSVLAGPYSWNAPTKAINPLEEVHTYVETPLERMIASYQHDEAVSRMMRIAAMTEEEKKPSISGSTKLICSKSMRMNSICILPVSRSLKRRYDIVHY